MRILAIGDSIAGRNTVNLTGTITTTSTGTTVNVQNTAHGVTDQGLVAVFGYDQEAYNGVFVATAVDADNFQYTALSTPSASPATGSGVVYSLDRLGDSGIAKYACDLSLGKMQFVGHLGHGGSRIADAVTNFNNYERYFDYDYVMVFTGANNCANATTDADDYADYVDLFNAIRRKRKGFGVCSILPAEAGYTPNSGTETQFNAKVARLNSWLQYQARKHNFQYFDLYSQFVDDASATGSGLATLMGSNDLHPLKRGVYVAADIVNDDLSPVLISGGYVSAAAIQNVTSDSASPQKYPNPVMTTAAIGGLSAGSATSPFTGTVARGHTVSNNTNTSGTCSVDARSDGNGFNQTIAITASAAGSARLTGPQLSSLVTAGQKYVAEVEIGMSGVGSDFRCAATYLLITAGGLTTYVYLNSTINGTDSPGADHVMLVRGSEFIMPASVTSIVMRSDIFFTAAGSVTVTFGRPSLLALPDEVSIIPSLAASSSSSSNFVETLSGERLR